jgi:hypothetical protein
MPSEDLLEILQRNFAPGTPTEPKENMQVQMPQIRFRPPYLQTSKHDARGDALNLALEFMLQK